MLHCERVSFGVRACAFALVCLVALVQLWRVHWLTPGRWHIRKTVRALRRHPALCAILKANV